MYYKARTFPFAILIFLSLGAFILSSKFVNAQVSSTQVQRSELAEMYFELAAIGQAYPDAVPPMFSDRAFQAMNEVNDLSDNDMEILAKALKGTPNWRLTSHLLRSALEVKTITSLDALPGAEPPNCPAGLPNGIIDLYIAKDVAQGFAFLTLFAPDDLVTVIACNGGTISAHPIKLALQLAYEAANTAALVAEQINALNDECETNAHRALLRAVDDKLTEMDHKLDKVLELLIMPHGQRPGFPLKDNEDDTGKNKNKKNKN